MTKTKLKNAVEKYLADYIKNPEQTIELIKTDYDEADAAEIIEELKTAGVATGKNQPPAPKKAPSNTHYKRFDEFMVRIMKKEVTNVLANKKETIILGWTLEKKLVGKLIEERQALYLNSFANGFTPDAPQPYLVLEATMTQGDFIPYAQWAKEQGINPAEDINLLLAPKS